MAKPDLEKALQHFGSLIERQLQRVEVMKQQTEWTDYNALKPIIIGIVGGDGIGPYIAGEAQRVLEFSLKEESEFGKVEFRTIEDLTIERRAEIQKAIPDDVLEELKK
ncbi:isocitrate/isopropylmalate dehydrogenase family protein, partial [candidate division KSB1 bacterium]|nr:isocitrate/isopropylmalate dehydrogenase family protein [candidate division KSB1 bacterium]NIR71268.1 isocitrate/isopropylmalate dehydrogenase family protein [candidate division KSB1 bacterium]NIS24797.1 isocitrate/isopropylmalate dehydrogenase family protein [candidate division KSB1 bacterium]NIT71704.1 isocitrate/isopropylmalate dehydrogenase family protein [candidate division KSB1 bacterium]NIU25433.1 isocitrate/isopropylmalate dehydrogenase family protein [candidate division KSB1 bacteri